MSTERFEFQTETKELLHLMIHSLYSNKDIFLRELISNASDAIDKRRFAAVTGDAPAVEDPQIRIVVDAEARTITIDDDGIGMSRDEVVSHIGTIAKSGTREFAQLLADKKSDAGNLIGQFGVGFYSSFLAADTVELLTRRAGEDTATRWSSAGHDGYELEDADRDRPGTSIVLHLKAADEEDGLPDYTEEHLLRSIVRRYSDFVAYPIHLHKGDDEESKALNSMKAIWARPQGEVEDSEYSEFYKHISHDWNDPLLRVSTKIEGTFEATALLYVPEKAPFGIHHSNVNQRGLQLYVRRVFIMDGCEELTPRYLRFLSGVIDAEDLPLNVSREILQQNRQVAAIRKHVTKKVLDRLLDTLKTDRETYLKFWGQLGDVLKEGLMRSEGQELKILDLLLASTTASEELTTLEDYVSRMNEDQKVIYYMSGSDAAKVKASPILEGFEKRGLEVLILTDPVDELWVGDFGLKYKDIEFQSAAQSDIDFGDDEEAEKPEGMTELLAKIRSALQEEVKEVRMSSRLTSSPACLVSSAGDLTPQMERLLRANGQSPPPVKRILEVNPGHDLIQALGKNELLLDDCAKLLYAQAVLAEGGELADVQDFAQRMTALMVHAARG